MKGKNMFEVLMLGLAYLPISLATKYLTKENSYLNMLFGGVSEGLIGEVAEESVEWLVNKFTDRHKRAKVLAEAVRETLVNIREGFEEGTYNADDLNAFDSFIGTLKKSEALKKKIKEAKTNKKFEYESFDKGFSETQKVLKNALSCDPKGRNKAVEKIFKEYANTMEKYIDAKLVYKDEFEIAEKYLCIKDAKNNLPELAKVLMKKMFYCIYEIKYITLADDDRNVVKLMQQITMNSEKELGEKVSEKIVNSLTNYFQLILQQNAHLTAHPIADGERDSAPEEGSTVSLARRRLAKLAEKDNLVWIEHVCPKCGARGDSVDRNGDTLKCNICGMKSSIFEEPSDTVKDMLEEVGLISTNTYYLAENIKKSVSSVERGITNIDGAVKRIIMTDAEIVENVIALRDDHAGMAEYISNAFEDIKERLNETGAGIRGVIDRLDSQYEEMVSLHKEIDAIETDLSEIKTALNTNSENDREFLRQIITTITWFKGTGGGTHDTPMQTCPICGRTDRKWSGNIHTVCGVPSEAKDGVWNITLKYLEGHNKLLYVPSKSNVGSSVGRVIIKGKACGYIRNKNITCLKNYDETTSEELSLVKNLIISSTAEIDIDEYALSKFLDNTRSVVRIVFASCVQFISGGKLSGWNYDPQNRILIRMDGD